MQSFLSRIIYISNIDKINTFNEIVRNIYNKHFRDNIFRITKNKVPCKTEEIKKLLKLRITAEMKHEVTEKLSTRKITVKIFFL